LLEKPGETRLTGRITHGLGQRGPWDRDRPAESARARIAITLRSLRSSCSNGPASAVMPVMRRLPHHGQGRGLPRIVPRR
jgi:hypothetical protein